MARPLTVLHIDTERGWRGGERQVLWLAREMAALGHRPLIAARPGEPLAMRASGAGIEVVPCSPRGELDLRAAWNLRATLRRADVDVVHAHTAHAVTLSAFATFGLRLPMVAARRVDFPVRSKWKYRRAARIIAVSEAVSRVLVDGGIDPRQISVVHDGTDLDRKNRPASAQTLWQLGIPAGAPLVVQVAQLVGHKDPLNFVRAMRTVIDACPAAHGLMVGEGPLRAKAMQEARDLGVESRVHFAGYRDDADSLLAVADVVCLSSREEGMGSVLLDSLVFGRPVAATRAGGIPEVVVDGETGLLAPVGDPKRLGEAILQLLGDVELRSRMGVAALARAAHFSVAGMAERTIDVYREVVRSSSVA